MIAERRNTIEHLSLRRMGFFGTAVGVLLVALAPLSTLLTSGHLRIPRDFVPGLVVLGILGGSSAMASLNLARRGIGPSNQRQLPAD
jgi:hypothetical protein